MSDAEAAVIDTGAEVAIPEGEVTHEQLVKILEDARAADPEDEAVEAPAVEEPVAPVKDPAAERVSARIIASRRAEMRAAEDRATLAKERAEIEAGKAAVAEHIKIAEQVKAAKLSPSKALELLGLSPREFIHSLATENEPEAIAKRAVSATQSETERLAAEVVALRRERDEERRQIQAEAATRRNYAVQENFISHVAEQAANYPYLTEEFTPQEIAERGWQVATKHADAYKAKFGVFPDDSVIADFLETEAKARAEARAAWRERIGKTAPNPSQGNPAIQGQPLKANSPRTLTNGASSQKATAPKPWSQEDADAESKRILQQMYASADE